MADVADLRQPPTGALRAYALVTAGYWVFTLTDGALRMLVLLHFNALGYSPVAIAFLFLAYELVGVATNLVGGWVGARRGLNTTLIAGLALQIVALLALTAQQPGWQRWASVAFVMGVQALSGVAKDLTKMSSKTAVKTIAAQGSLFRLVAVLTGSKNALKGVGFFLGAALLATIGYTGALVSMAAAVAVTMVALLALLRVDIGKATSKPPLRSILSKSAAINRLSAARMFLFGARDIWFVVAVPVFLADRLGWSSEAVGGFLSLWLIGYGIVQSLAPTALGSHGPGGEVRAEKVWILVLLAVTAALALAVTADVALPVVVVGGLIVFGVVFAINSSLHSYLILAYSSDEGVSLDVGYYYSANALGRLIGTFLSGVTYMAGGLGLSLWVSAVFVAASSLLAARLPSIAATEPSSDPARQRRLA